MIIYIYIYIYLLHIYFIYDNIYIFIYLLHIFFKNTIPWYRDIILLLTWRNLEYLNISIIKYIYIYIYLIWFRKFYFLVIKIDNYIRYLYK